MGNKNTPKIPINNNLKGVKKLILYNKEYNIHRISLNTRKLYLDYDIEISLDFAIALLSSGDKAHRIPNTNKVNKKLLKTTL